MNVGEVLLTDRLREKGRRIDAIYTHHPEGMALSKLDRVMEMQAEIWETWGVPIHVGESLMAERRVEVRRRFMPMNSTRPSTPRALLEIPFFSAHTPTDNLVTTTSAVPRRSASRCSSTTCGGRCSRSPSTASRPRRGPARTSVEEKRRQAGRQGAGST